MQKEKGCKEKKREDGMVEMFKQDREMTETCRNIEVGLRHITPKS